MDSCKTPNEFMKLELSGNSYKLSKKMLLNYPESRLGRICLEHELKSENIFFERPQTAFDAILTYYKTGKLHMPSSICPSEFIEELEFWEISPLVMEKCCFYRYNAFIKEQENIRCFELTEEDSQKDKYNYPKTKLGKVRSFLWNILDYKTDTVLPKIYFVVSVVFIMLSVLSVAMSTLPSVKQTQETNTLIAPTTTAVPDSVRTGGKWVETVASKHIKQNITTKTPNLLANIIYSTKHWKKDGQTNQDINYTSKSVAIAGSSYTLPYLDSEPNETTVNTIPWFILEDPVVSFEAPVNKIPTIDTALTNKFHVFTYIEHTTIAFFLLELVLRLFSCPSRAEYFCNLYNWIDIVVIMGSFGRYVLHFFAFKHSYLQYLLYLQMLRVLRLLRVMQNVSAFKVLKHTLKVSKKDIVVMFIYIIIVTLMFSNFVYIVEENEDFPSIPDTWWWCIVTMTTVGYGDMVPKTTIGKVLGAVCAVAGVVVFSLIIPIFVRNFVMFYDVASHPSKVGKDQEHSIAENEIQPNSFEANVPNCSKKS